VWNHWPVSPSLDRDVDARDVDARDVVDRGAEACEVEVCEARGGRNEDASSSAASACCDVVSAMCRGSPVPLFRSTHHVAPDGFSSHDVASLRTRPRGAAACSAHRSSLPHDQVLA
jgi:hypothetical protein